MTPSAPKRRRLLRLSVILSALAIVGANAYPLAGILWLDWNPLVVLATYWLETLAIVLFNVPKIRRACGPRESDEPAFTYSREPAPGSEASAFLSISTLFMAGHAFALFALFAGVRGSPIMELPDVPPDSIAVLFASGRPVLIGFLGFFLSEAVYHFAVFIGDGVYLHVSPRKQMDSPMGRILGMQVIILMSGVVGGLLGGIRPTLALAIVLKTLIELVALHWQRLRVQEASGLANPKGEA